MVDWKSPAVQLACLKALGKISNACYGIYAWEIFTSLHFEWEYLSGKRRFRWPLVFYFANRYVLLLNMTASLVLFNFHATSPSDLNCNALYVITYVCGNVSLGLASINLAIRTLVLWAQNVFVTAFMVVIIIGHWVIIILQARTAVGHYSPGIGCTGSGSNLKLLGALFSYSLCLDTIILGLTAVKLFGWNPKSLLSGGLALNRTKKQRLFKLSNVLFQQGLIFYVIAFAVNLLEITFLFLDLNLVMTSLFAIVAELASTIVACRAVRGLSNFLESGNKGTINFISTLTSASQSSRSHSAGKINHPVDVELDIFQQEENSRENFASRTEQESGLKMSPKPSVL